MQFPSWRYHKSGDSKIVQNEDEHAALGEGWADTPAAHLPLADPDRLPADDALTPLEDTPPADPETNAEVTPARRPSKRR